MLDNLKLENILFLDIETVPAEPSFDDFSDSFKELWIKKVDTLKVLKEGESADDRDVFYRAGIYAEFGKIICISVGFITVKNGERILRVKSYYDIDEPVILKDFCEMLNKFHSNNPSLLLCAHNGKEFDFPYISRRLVVNGIKIPRLLDLAGKKPWEVPHLDTMELWKFGDYKSFTSLKLLTATLSIPSPKDDIDGSDVAAVYWEENDIERIVKYCQKDVVAIAQIMMRFKGEELIKQDNIEIV